MGYPKYYERVGFKEIGKLGIENKSGIENEFVLGLEIIVNSLENIKGYIDEIE